MHVLHQLDHCKDIMIQCVSMDALCLAYIAGIFWLVVPIDAYIPPSECKKIHFDFYHDELDCWRKPAHLPWIRNGSPHLWQHHSCASATLVAPGD